LFIIVFSVSLLQIDSYLHVLISCFFLLFSVFIGLLQMGSYLPYFVFCYFSPFVLLFVCYFSPFVLLFVFCKLLHKYVSMFLAVTFLRLFVCCKTTLSYPYNKSINVVLMVETCFQLCNTHSNKAVFTAIKNHFVQIAVTKYQFYLPTSVD